MLSTMAVCMCDMLHDDAMTWCGFGWCANAWDPTMVVCCRQGCGGSEGSGTRRLVAMPIGVVMGGVARCLLWSGGARSKGQERSSPWGNVCVCVAGRLWGRVDGCVGAGALARMRCAGAGGRCAVAPHHVPQGGVKTDRRVGVGGSGGAGGLCLCGGRGRVALVPCLCVVTPAHQPHTPTRIAEARRDRVARLSHSGRQRRQDVRHSAFPQRCSLHPQSRSANTQYDCTKSFKSRSEL